MGTELNEPQPEASPIRSRGWGLPVALAIVTVVAVAVIGVGIVNLTTDDPPAETVTFIVPEGTLDRAASGETVEIMPETVPLSVGDTLVIRNDDDGVVSVGPYTVRPGETLTQRFDREQVLIGECSLSGSGEVEIVVT